MNRRSFIQKCFACVAGAAAVFAPGKPKPNCSSIIPVYTGLEDSIEPGNKPRYKYLYRKTPPTQKVKWSGISDPVEFNQSWFQPQVEPLTEEEAPPKNIWVSAERNPICPICDKEMYLSLISKFPSTQFFKCEKSPHYWTYDKDLFLTGLNLNGEKVLLLT